MDLFFDSAFLLTPEHHSWRVNTPHKRDFIRIGTTESLDLVSFCSNEYCMISSWSKFNMRQLQMSLIWMGSDRSELACFVKYFIINCYMIEGQYPTQTRFYHNHVLHLDRHDETLPVKKLWNLNSGQSLEMTSVRSASIYTKAGHNVG